MITQDDINAQRLQIESLRAELAASEQRISELTAENKRLAQLSPFAAGSCMVCGGQPLASGRECVCGGKGTTDEELRGLRIAALDAGECKAELESALATARQANEWQPIESAPRDATPILVGLISDGRVWRVSDAKFYGVGFYTVHGGKSCHWATHWQPLPAPPV